jgi:hypothetical protein
MKTKMPALTQTVRPLIRFLLAATIVAVTLTALTSGAQAVVVQNTYRIINAGSADFGFGNHSVGSPVSNATITFDWGTGTGQLRPTGRVQGTLYWDSLFSAGCARLTIRFRNTANENLDVRQIDVCGPGGDANNAANRVAVDESWSSVNLDKIHLTVAEIRGGSAINPVVVVIQQVTQKSFPVTINNGKADFGDGGHHFGHPDEPGYITFRRNGDGTVTGGIDGILYWDAFDDDSCARMVIDHRDSTGTILRHRDRLNCGPGGDANNGANQLFLTEPLTSGSLSDIRILVQDTAAPRNGILRTYNFAGQVGDFEVEPIDAVASVNEPINFSFTWTVPEPLTWHDLDSLELRIMDGSTRILHVRFEEAGNFISVFNEGTGEFGRGFPAGSNTRLQTRYGMLDLGETTVGPVNSVLGTGPNSPTVRLDLAFRFKPSAAGKTYQVEVAARDDLGNEDPFILAGTLTVNR